MQPKFRWTIISFCKQNQSIYQLSQTPTHNKENQTKSWQKDDKAQRLNQFLAQPNDPTDVDQVIIVIYDVNIPKLTPSARIESQLSRHTYIVSPATTKHYIEEGPHLVELQKILTKKTWKT